MCWAALAKEPSSVDVQSLAGDEPGGRQGEVRNRLGDVRGRAAAFDALAVELTPFHGGKIVDNLRFCLDLDGTGRDAVGGDAVRSEFSGECPHQAFDPGL